MAKNKRKAPRSLMDKLRFVLKYGLPKERIAIRAVIAGFFRQVYLRGKAREGTG